MRGWRPAAQLAVLGTGCACARRTRHVSVFRDSKNAKAPLAGPVHTSPRASQLPPPVLKPLLFLFYRWCCGLRPATAPALCVACPTPNPLPSCWFSRVFFGQRSELPHPCLRACRGPSPALPTTSCSSRSVACAVGGCCADSKH
jgi:hypothetical protein